MKELKYSRQREAVSECLRNRYDHPTADILYQSLRKEFPHISLGTVYRNLNLLSGMGEIRKIECGDGIERYDYNTRDHYHFVCKGCGKVKDLPIEPITGLNDKAVDEDIGIVESHSLIFYGYCRECYRKAQSTKNKIKTKENRS
jgi:Fur family peroxide stress response transcriptional regulator